MAVFRRLREAIRRKRPDLWAKHETKIIAQPPYSTDLTPCDFFVFPKLKYPLRGTRNESIEAIKRNSPKELKAIPAEAYKKCAGNWITVGILKLAQKEPILETIIKSCIEIHKYFVFF